MYINFWYPIYTADELTQASPLQVKLMTPDNQTRELMTSSDEIVVKYREWLRSWEKKGWRVDQRALKRNEGDVAYVVPSPARRESGNWVLPLVSAAE